MIGIFFGFWYHGQWPPALVLRKQSGYEVPEDKRNVAVRGDRESAVRFGFDLLQSFESDSIHYPACCDTLGDDMKMTAFEARNSCLSTHWHFSCFPHFHSQPKQHPEWPPCTAKSLPFLPGGAPISCLVLTPSHSLSLPIPVPHGRSRPCPTA